MICAVPIMTAVTRPCAETVATSGLAELQTSDRPGSAPPFPSSVVAVACADPPCTIETWSSDTVTEATGTGVTIIRDVPLLPSLVAVIVAEPAVCEITSPLASTDAIDGSFDVQAIARPVRRLSPSSFATAESCCDEPATNVAVAGLTDTLATGTGVTVTRMLEVLPSEDAAIVAVPELTAVRIPVEFPIDAMPASVLDH